MAQAISTRHKTMHRQASSQRLTCIGAQQRIKCCRDQRAARLHRHVRLMQRTQPACTLGRSGLFLPCVTAAACAAMGARATEGLLNRLACANDIVSALGLTLAQRTDMQHAHMVCAGCMRCVLVTDQQGCGLALPRHQKSAAPLRYQPRLRLEVPVPATAALLRSIRAPSRTAISLQKCSAA